MSSRVGSFIFLVAFGISATITSQLLWHLFGWLILVQLLLIFSIAAIGESFVSSQGYYHYTRQRRNGPFVRNVPVWIVFLWIFFIQSGLLFSLALGLDGFAAASMSGMVACAADFFLIEPFLSKYMELWRWTPVRRGYFSFIPAKLNRFTAPPGNYIAWLLFPMIVNGFLVFLFLTT
jgi:magnesium-transporting ATPase (P-type)